MGKAVVCAAAICVAAVCAEVVRHCMKCSGRWSQAVVIMKEFEEKCGTPLLKLRHIADAMTVDMHAGLASEGGSKLKMIISYVDNLPTGEKKLESKNVAVEKWWRSLLKLSKKSFIGQRQKNMKEGNIREVVGYLQPLWRP